MRVDLFALHAGLEDHHWWFRGRRRIIRDLVHTVLPAGTRGTILDVGCGTGANLAAFAGSCDCIGIDASPHAIELARQRFPAMRFEVAAHPSDAPCVFARADVLLLLDVLEHVRDDFEMLSAILAAMRPGAHLLVTVPADASLWSEHDVSYGHYRRYNAARLNAVWAGLPVRVGLLSYFNARLYPAIRAMRLLNRWRGRASGAAGTDLRLPPPPVNAMLERVFAGERRRLAAVARGERVRGFRRGVSLVALLERQTGEIHVRQRPADLAPDPGRPDVGSEAA